MVFYNTMKQYLRRFSIVWICLAALSLGEGAAAITRAEMYQGTAPLADRSDTAYTAAFQDAMKTVLIRVTGRRNADEDPALSSLVSNARRYVLQYRAAPDAQVWVAFDGPAIERWLTQNGQPLWGHERPVTLVLLAVPNGAQSGTVLTADDNSELKAAIDAAAAARGLPLLWPSAGELQRNHLDYAAVTSGSPSTISEVGRRFGGEGLLIGRASGAGARASVRWTHLFQDRSSEYSGHAADGVNRAADLYA